MRGAHKIGGTVGEEWWIIPADAGSTPCRAVLMADERDHPRGCGEHPTTRYKVTHRQGSSPRMRGALFVKPVTAREARIIPADAGSTGQTIIQSLFHEDHPRGCGEHRARDRPYARQAGSSPRMRGAHRHQSKELVLAGIIPADAGSTMQVSNRFGKAMDHPCLLYTSDAADE